MLRKPPSYPLQPSIDVEHSSRRRTPATRPDNGCGASIVCREDFKIPQFDGEIVTLRLDALLLHSRDSVARSAAGIRSTGRRRNRSPRCYEDGCGSSRQWSGWGHRRLRRRLAAARNAGDGLGGCSRSASTRVLSRAVNVVRAASTLVKYTPTRRGTACPLSMDLKADRNPSSASFADSIRIVSVLAMSSP